MANAARLVSAVHVKARCATYPSGPARAAVADHLVSWQTPFPEYAPVNYTAPSVAAGPVWADKPEQIRDYKFNALDGRINRRSHEGVFSLDPATSMPINPRGRTGMSGRGLLGRFGPNHAADPVVTRWKREGSRVVMDKSGAPLLEFVGVKRKDNGEWAIPGGMVEAGDTVSLTLKKEFGEEAMNTLELSPAEREEAHRNISLLFSEGWEVYKGYVDDPRNTDNAWMETVAMNFHDESGELTHHFKLHAGDDAGEVKWITVEPSLKLYASHAEFLHHVEQYRKSKYQSEHGGGGEGGAASSSSLPSSSSLHPPPSAASSSSLPSSSSLHLPPSAASLSASLVPGAAKAGGAAAAAATDKSNTGSARRARASKRPLPGPSDPGSPKRPMTRSQTRLLAQQDKGRKK